MIKIGGGCGDKKPVSKTAVSVFLVKNWTRQQRIMTGFRGFYSIPRVLSNFMRLML